MKTSKLLEALGFGMHLREGFEKGYASSKKNQLPGIGYFWRA
jgi:hypothetical protein